MLWHFLVLVNMRISFLISDLTYLWTSMVVDAPSLEAFKARLNVTLGSLVWWLATLHIAGGLKLSDHGGPFQPRPFYDSMILFLNFTSVPQRS